MSRTHLIRSAALAAVVLSASAAHAASWQWLPMVNDPGYKAEPSLAITGNRVLPGTGPNANAFGLEFNANCGLVQSPDKRIRTHVNLSRTDQDGVKVTALELSPRYTVPLGQGLSVGFGPSLGVFQVNTPARDRNLLGVGAAVGLNFRSGVLYTGFDVRYHSTVERDNVDHDPLTFGAKIGVNF
jgi:long-subunit fatty acid transport protein